MNKPLNLALSNEIAQQIKSKARECFNNAYQAALLTEGSLYVQGFLVLVQKPYIPIEHGWLELEDGLVDPTLPRLKNVATVPYYFPAQRLEIKQLKAAIEEAKEDYPEDSPLPVYGASPYEYYGDRFLGGKEYLEAYQQALNKCKELNQLTH